MTRSERKRSHSDDVMIASLADTGLALTPGVRDALRRLQQRRRTALTYVGRVVSHPCNLLLIFGVLLLSFIGWSLPVLLAGLVIEALILGISPWARFIRRHIDVQLDEADRAAASRARDALVQQMDVRHQQELSRLDRLLDRTRDNLERRAGDAFGPDHGPDPSWLTASYIRLAIAHRAGQESLATTSYHELMETIRGLEAVRLSSTARMREIAERRLAIAYRRVECWCRTREGLEAIGHQLATILELVQLMHEQSLAPGDAHVACTEIDRFMRELEASEGTLRELAALAAPDSGEASPDAAEEARAEEEALQALDEQSARRDGGARVRVESRSHQATAP